MDITSDELRGQLTRIESKLDRLLAEVEPVAVNVHEPQRVKLLNIVEAGKVLGMTPGAVRKEIKKIPHIEEKGQFYFKENELKAYIESSLSKSPYKSAQRKSTEYIGFDYMQWSAEQAVKSFIAGRDRAIQRERERAKNSGKG